MQATFRRYVPERPGRRERNVPDFSLSLLSFCLGQLIEVQAEYHRKSLELLQSILPQIKAHQGEFCPEFSRAGRASPRERAPAQAKAKKALNNHQRLSLHVTIRLLILL